MHGHMNVKKIPVGVANTLSINIHNHIVNVLSS
jgi:hypothetical protein